ncbi:MAG: fasciclin domain-containing protein [Bacteroidota bacterium]
MKITRFLAIGMMAAVLFLNGCLNDDDPAADLPNITELISSNNDLRTFNRALELTNLTSLLEGSDGVTIFAPNDFAFDTYIASNNFSSLEDIPLETLRNTLLYHIFTGKADIFEIGTGYYQTNSTTGPSNSQVVSLIIRENDITRINESATAVVTDIEGNNGFLHILDAVVTPPSLEEIFTVNPSFSIFMEGLERIGQTELLDSGQPITIFAPPNLAFDEFFSDNPSFSTVGEIPLDRLETLLLHHVIDGFNDGNTISADVSGVLQAYNTFAGDTLTISGSGSSLIVDNKALFISVNIIGTNGVAHFLDKVLDGTF